MGFVLTLTALQVRGRLDLSELITKRAALVEGRVAPSAALQVIANMGVNAHVTRTGLRTVSTMHSSTYVDGKVNKSVRISRNELKQKLKQRRYKVKILF